MICYSHTAIEDSVDTTNKKESFEKDSAISKIVSDLRSKKIERMRRYGSNDDLKLLAEIALVPMMSKETWKHNGRSVELSTLTTVADEAFALLTMENNVDEWIKLKVHGKDSVVKGENCCFRVNFTPSVVEWLLSPRERIYVMVHRTHTFVNL